MVAKVVDNSAIHRQITERLFATLAANIGMEPEPMEEWCNRTLETLQLLLKSQYREEEKHFEKSMDYFSNVMEDLLERPDRHRLNKRMQVILQIGFNDIMDRADESIRAQISEVEIALFCLVAREGRATFENNKQPADAFVPELIFKLAKMVRDNYTGYEETLQGLRA